MSDITTKGNATPVHMLELAPIAHNTTEFVDKLRWIIRAAKRADGVVDAGELGKIIDQYYPQNREQ